MTIKFNDSPNLGQTIEKKSLLSFGVGPLNRLSELAYCAGANKFSQLCGFRFISKSPHQYKEFFISFVCKYRSKTYRQQSDPPKWYIYKKISDNEYHALSKSQTLAQYGFDVNEFFKSDLFERAIPIFSKAIKNGLTVQVPELQEKYKNNHEASILIPQYARTIEEAMYKIRYPIVNDKFYKLINYDVKLEKELNQKIEEALATIYN